MIYPIVKYGARVLEAEAALVLARAVREKFGGDTLEEALRNFRGYQEQLRNF